MINIHAPSHVGEAETVQKGTWLQSKNSQTATYLPFSGRLRHSLPFQALSWNKVRHQSHNMHQCVWKLAPERSNSVFHVAQYSLCAVAQEDSLFLNARTKVTPWSIILMSRFEDYVQSVTFYEWIVNCVHIPHCIYSWSIVFRKRWLTKKTIWHTSTPWLPLC